MRRRCWRANLVGMFVVVGLSVIKRGRKGIEHYRTILSAKNQRCSSDCRMGALSAAPRRLCVDVGILQPDMGTGMGGSKRSRSMNVLLEC